MFHNDKNIKFNFRNFYIKKYVQNKTKTLRLLRIDDIVNNEKFKYVINFIYEKNNINLKLKKNLINFSKKNLKRKLKENIEMNIINEFIPKLYLSDLIEVLYFYYKQKNKIKNKKIEKFMNFYIEKQNYSKNSKNEVISVLGENKNKSKLGILEKTDKNIFDTLDETLNIICKNLKRTGKTKNKDNSKSFTFLKNSKIDFRDSNRYLCINREKFRSIRNDDFFGNDKILKNYNKKKKFRKDFDYKEKILKNKSSKKLLKKKSSKYYSSKKFLKKESSKYLSKNKFRESEDKNLTKKKIKEKFFRGSFENKISRKKIKENSEKKKIKKNNSKKNLKKFNFNIIN